MNIERIHHLNIRCAVADLAPMEQFYTTVVGLRRGHRPALRNQGIWFYLGEQPVVHVTARCEPGFVQGEHRGSIDHIAFQSRGAAEFLDKLRQLKVSFEEQNVENAGYQIFLRDPLGTVLEFNFPNSEAPQSTAAGTFAPRNATTPA